MSEFANQSCKACKAGESALTPEQAKKYLSSLDSTWLLADDGKSIHRSYKFGNYYETMAFVNLVAMVAHQQDHHPDMNVSYNKCRVEYSTHSIGGLSVNDFICAAKIDKSLHL